MESLLNRWQPGPYAISKLEAEMAIQDLCKNSMTDYIILRPPLIYGKDAPGCKSISLFLKYKLPLPFGGISNKSFIAIENLLSVINLLFLIPKH